MNRIRSTLARVARQLDPDGEGDCPRCGRPRPPTGDVPRDAALLAAVDQFSVNDRRDFELLARKLDWSACPACAAAAVETEPFTPDERDRWRELSGRFLAMVAGHSAHSSTAVPSH